MAKYCGGAMAITVLFRTTISDLLCSDSLSLSSHRAGDRYSHCPILRSEIQGQDSTKTHLHHLQTGQHAHSSVCLKKSDMSFLRQKGLNRIIKCDCWRVYLEWRHSVLALGPGWRQEDHFTGDAGCNSRDGSEWLNAEGTGSETKLNKYWGTQSAASWSRAAVHCQFQINTCSFLA